jgi:hypothetical protein
MIQIYSYRPSYHETFVFQTVEVADVHVLAIARCHRTPRIPARFLTDHSKPALSLQVLAKLIFGH